MNKLLAQTIAPLSRAGVVVLFGVLAACGGGGGGDDTRTTSGLVPPAGTPGATLFADAIDIRPLVAGASWRYDGVDSDGNAYSNLVTQAGAPTGVLETSTNLFADGASEVHVAEIAGNIVQPDAVDLDGDNINDVSNVIELRSPVRVNDQIVSFDRHLPEVVPDLDGDGRAEALDLAMYSQVVGLQDVTLAGGTVSAVRVDHIIAARAVTSKDGIETPVVKLTQSVWYSESLGIVRQRLDAPADDGVSRLISDERLAEWDGLPGAMR